jgi:plasmid stabilization system protein ParE
MLTKAVFIREMAMLEERYNRDMQEPVLDRYYESLKQLTDADFTRAARYIFDNDDYWPSPKRFIELAHGTTKDAAQPRMGTPHRRLREATTPTHPSAPQASLAMRRAGGWREIAYAEGPNKQEQLKRLFIAAYETETRNNANTTNSKTATRRLLS